MSSGNCPNCNAILSYEGGLHCDYCGAWFEEPRYAVLRDWSGEPVCAFKPGDWPSPPNLETR